MESPQGLYWARAAIVGAVKTVDKHSYIQAVAHSSGTASMTHLGFAEEGDAVVKGVFEAEWMVLLVAAGAAAAIVAVVAGVVVAAVAVVAVVVVVVAVAVAVAGVEHLPEARSHAVKSQGR